MNDCVTLVNEAKMIFTWECPQICTLTRLCSTVASISRCACTSWVSMCRQSSEKQFLSSTLAITDSWETILFSRYSTVSACVEDKNRVHSSRNKCAPRFAPRVPDYDELRKTVAGSYAHSSQRRLISALRLCYRKLMASNYTIATTRLPVK